jgi:colanic acid/amylovoran biosynthesis glycosyltransferase
VSGPSSRRPRLLVLASTFPASAGDSAPAFVRDLAAYESRQYDTTVLVPSVPGGASREETHGVSVVRFRYFLRRWEDLADGAILENLRARKSRWLQVAPFLVAETWAVRRLVRDLDPDVLHVHWIIPQGLVALVAKGRRPMLVTTLGGDLYGLRDPVTRLLIKAVLRRTAAVTTMNEDMRQRVIDLGARPEHVTVLPMGADVDGIRALTSGVNPVAGRILFVGRLVEKKGAGVLLAAMRLPPAQGYELRIVGGGPLRQDLEALAEGLPVTFLGALHRSELALEYAAASVVVFPSVLASSGDQDGLPVALLEAMAAGRPVIVSALPGLADAVEDGVSGRVVRSGDPQSLAAAIGSILADETEAQRLGRGASERADAYSVRSVGERYVGLLNGLRRRDARRGAPRRGVSP